MTHTKESPEIPGGFSININISISISIQTSRDRVFQQHSVLAERFGCRR